MAWSPIIWQTFLHVSASRNAWFKLMIMCGCVFYVHKHEHIHRFHIPQIRFRSTCVSNKHLDVCYRMQVHNVIWVFRDTPICLTSIWFCFVCCADMNNRHTWSIIMSYKDMSNDSNFDAYFKVVRGGRTTNLSFVWYSSPVVVVSIQQAN